MKAITWRNGWATSKIDRLDEPRQEKRRDQLRKALRQALPQDVTMEQYVVLQADLTTRGSRKFRLSDLTDAARICQSILGEKCTGVIFKPTQYATPAWHGTQEEYKAHRRKVRKLARRYRRRGMAGIADGLLRSLRYHATLSVELVGGVPDIRGGLDTGEQSTYYLASPNQAVAMLPATGNWISFMSQTSHGGDEVSELFTVFNRLCHFDRVRHHRVIRLVARRGPKSEVTLRDWGKT